MSRIILPPGVGAIDRGAPLMDKVSIRQAPLGPGRKRMRSFGKVRAERHISQGGGPFTRLAPAVRRHRRRIKNKAARAARRYNR